MAVIHPTYEGRPILLGDTVTYRTHHIHRPPVTNTVVGMTIIRDEVWLLIATDNPGSPNREVNPTHVLTVIPA